MLAVFVLFAGTEFVSAGANQDTVLEDAIEWQGHYYKIFPMNVNWETAKKFCESIGGHLATAETQAENEMLKQFFLKYGKDVKAIRIGGYRDDAGIWRWVTGKIIASYFDWGNGQPRGERTLIFSRDIDGKWATVNDYDNPCEAYH